jgi:O-antigen/teichoic acid export membrane protein
MFMFKSKLERLKSVFLASGKLALGEGTARVCAMLTLVLVSRVYGASTLGSLALAQTLAIYISLALDAGSRHIGARLLAAHPDHVQSIQDKIQKRRELLALVAIPVGFLYARLGPIPGGARDLVSIYILLMAPYCLSLDWVLWGANRYGSLSVSRALISVLPLAALALAMLSGLNPNWAIPIAAGIGYGGSTAYSRWRCSRIFRGSYPSTTECPVEVRSETSWKAIFILGLALACNQAFNNIDSLMLGGLTNLQQVGLYSSAYKLLNGLLGVYYLVTTALYPRIAAIPPERRTASRLWPFLIPLFVSGVLPALVIRHFSRWIIISIYGSKFAHGAPMLSLLILSLPLDFVTAFCGITMVAWGMSKRVLVATGTAAVVNIGTNIYLIPRYGGMGACWATLISYLVLIVAIVAMLPWRGPSGGLSAEDFSTDEHVAGSVL